MKLASIFTYIILINIIPSTSNAGPVTLDLFQFRDTQVLVVGDQHDVSPPTEDLSITAKRLVSVIQRQLRGSRKVVVINENNDDKPLAARSGCLLTEVRTISRQLESSIPECADFTYINGDRRPLQTGFFLALELMLYRNFYLYSPESNMDIFLQNVDFLVTEYATSYAVSFQAFFRDYRSAVEALRRMTDATLDQLRHVRPASPLIDLLVSEQTRFEYNVQPALAALDHISASVDYLRGTGLNTLFDIGVYFQHRLLQGADRPLSETDEQKTAAITTIAEVVPTLTPSILLDIADVGFLLEFGRIVEARKEPHLVIIVAGEAHTNQLKMVLGPVFSDGPIFQRHTTHRHGLSTEEIEDFFHESGLL